MRFHLKRDLTLEIFEVEVGEGMDDGRRSSARDAVVPRSSPMFSSAWRYFRAAFRWPRDDVPTVVAVVAVLSLTLVIRQKEGRYRISRPSSVTIDD